MTIPTAQIEAACALLRAAMESEQHVFVEWAAHVQKVYVRAFPASTKYVEGHSREALIDETVRLGGEAEYFDTDPLPREAAWRRRFSSFNGHIVALHEEHATLTRQLQEAVEERDRWKELGRKAWSLLDVIDPNGELTAELEAALTERSKS